MGELKVLQCRSHNGLVLLTHSINIHNNELKNNFKPK